MSDSSRGSRPGRPCATKHPESKIGCVACVYNHGNGGWGRMSGYLTYSKRKPRPSGRGPSDRPDRKTARLRPSGVGYRCNSSAEIKPGVGRGPLRRYGHAAVISRGVKTTGLNRPPSSQNPYPSLESGGNVRATRMGRRHLKITAPAVLEPPRRGGEVGRWHVLCRGGAKALLRISPLAPAPTGCWGGGSATSGATLTGRRHHAFTAPTWNARPRNRPTTARPSQGRRTGQGGGEDTRLGRDTNGHRFAGWCA